MPIPIDNERVKGDYENPIPILELPKLQMQENKVTKVNINSSSNKHLASSESETDSVKEELNTNNSGESSANNVDATSDSAGYGNQDVWEDSQQTSEQTAAN